MVKWLLATSLSLITLSAISATPASRQIKSIEIKELSTDAYHLKMLRMDTGIGEVISIGKELVALGEDIYNLVQKGKPSISIGEFVPVQVIPKIPGTNNYVDPMDVYGTVEMPMVKRYKATVKNMLNQNVVTYEFMLHFEYGGQYEGKGRYIQNAFIIPSNVRLYYGWDFSAQMSLVGISNSGTKDNPIAGATLKIKHSFGSVLNSSNNDLVLKITGNGKVIRN